MAKIRVKLQMSASLVAEVKPLLIAGMSAIDPAAERLDQAVHRLERAVAGLFEKSGDPVIMRRELSIMSEDRAKLADQLDASLAREKELKALADEASEALGAAIAEVRAALGREGED